MDYIMLGDLCILSILDVRSKKVPLVMLTVAMAAAILYGCKQGGFGYMILGVIPGILLCMVSICLPECLGLGDGLLGIVYGALYGWKQTCIWYLYGMFLAAVFGVCRNICFGISIKRKETIPFIPMLTIVHIGGIFV